MNPSIDFASTDDFQYLLERDSLKKDRVEKKIRDKEYIVAKEGGNYLGFLRFSLFWSEIPYIDIVKVETGSQKKGVGKNLVKFLENFTIQDGGKIVFSSSEKDELAPQIWHEKIGFRKAGIIKDLSPVQKTPEIIFIKKLEK